ncbi:hypothetical protein [Sphingopyxis sp. R3-92]|uniref:hypothetical protein n=1 Tax=Sphingopyxis sp. R3-92 TaxID=3158553 RepID=UPI003EE6B2D2
MALAAAAPPPPAGSQAEADGETARIAAQAIEGGHSAEAAGILETLVAPRHHMLMISSDWHRDLARAYVALGLMDGAQGQYRLALASAPSEEAGVLGDELAALVARYGRKDVVPDTLGPNGAKYFGLRWVDRGNGTIEFATVFLLPQDDPEGTAFTTATYRADCAAQKTQLLGGAAFSAAGKTLRSFGKGEAARPANDLADHSLKMMCRREPALQVKRVPSIDGTALLTRYRAQRLKRTASPPSAAEGGASDAACRAHVEMFVGQLAAEGQVSGPSWQVRDWWDMRTGDMTKERLAAATSAVAALARADPGIERTFQQACVQQALAGGAVPGL